MEDRRHQSRAARRFLFAVLGVALVEVALAVAALPTGLTPYLLACAAVTTALALIAYRLVSPRRSDDDDGRGGGPGGPQPEDPPPPWWPEFEAALRRHTAAQERARGRPRVPS